MRLVFINPNSTQAMTDAVTAVARRALPEADITGLTNCGAPEAIEGAADGVLALPGVLSLVRQAREADAIVIACFDDTGLSEARDVSDCPVLGIGQASYLMAKIMGRRFSVVTSVPVSLPVIRENIERSGFSGDCVSIRASGLPVLEIDRGREETRARLAEEILRARDEDGAEAVILGCAGMAPLRADLAARTGMVLIDGVAAAAVLAQAAHLAGRVAG
ncbi:aspartate/glutamate racemase family protein [Heliomarina baculiformis]|uniref:aspartate/glutamate racemase family protein n=1 Tax=Heliomarina baculiformis TaxID=2872036 RepID=UPI001EE34E76|nr:aspartate/glutamate racemase family protein [Heliomarina baculiformis]